LAKIYQKASPLLNFYNRKETGEQKEDREKAIKTYKEIDKNTHVIECVDDMNTKKIITGMEHDLLIKIIQN
jgi:hypothetical protein